MLSDRTEIALRIWTAEHQDVCPHTDNTMCFPDAFRLADQFLEASVVKCPSCYPPDVSTGAKCSKCNVELCLGRDQRPEVQHRVQLVAGMISGMYACNICLIGRGTR